LQGEATICLHHIFIHPTSQIRTFFLSEMLPRFLLQAARALCILERRDIVAATG